MKKFIAYFLLIGCTGFAATRNEDLKVILEKTYLQSQCEPLLNMMAMEAIADSQKKIDAEELIAKFRKDFGTEKTLSKFSKPYAAIFSDEEVRELRKIHENPVWQKYYAEGAPIFQTQMENMKETFKELAASFTTEEKEVVANGEILEVTEENFNQIAESEKPVIVDINASWCNPCKMMEPILEELSEKYKGKIEFAKIDFDSQSELVKQYDVTSLPTILFIKPGQKKPAIKSVGFISKKDFEAKIADFLKSTG